VHIVLPNEKLPIRQSIYFDIADGRMIFAIPRGRTTYVGTTDTNYEGDIDKVVITHEDAAYLINGVNENFPKVKLKVEDIESSWAGLRPLIHEDGKSASELSRKDEIFISPSGLYSIAGGKLTGYRKMAERIVDMVIDNHPRRRETSKCYTHKIRLADGQLINSKRVRRYVNVLKKRMISLGLDQHHASYFVENYGKQTEKILTKVSKVDGEDIQLTVVKEELRYCVEKEMTCSSVDFFMRRTGRLYFDIGRVFKYKEQVINELALLLNWDDEIKHTDRDKLESAINDARNFLKDA
ncbi:MAG: FAD-dependent oxidoreductase, partial [Cyclobacteriaceae bacterium]